MKTNLSLILSQIVASLAFVTVLPASSADAPKEKSAQSDVKSSAPAQADKEKKSTVTPHNHMRDGKGLWVPERKSRKEKKPEASGAGKSASAGDTKN